MNLFKYSFFVVSMLALYSSCEKNDSLTAAECSASDASCVRIRNTTNSDLLAATLRLSSVEDPVDLGDLAAGATSDYVLVKFADFCNYRLDATGPDQSSFRSGGWICTQADPLGPGRFTIELRPSPAIPAEFDILDAELIRE
ncbi:MAG: hypothetical protein AAGA31_09230 [Bacteroidota bacterium]